MVSGFLPPTVLVSSTFYDLQQVREDLRRFIEDELGYRALLSEHRSFPIDPGLDTIENCRERVRRDADVLVLLIGGRYGYIDPHLNRSVTNLEYLAAKEKGVPVYGFVHRGILPLLATYKANPSADFSHAVDTPRLFEFIQQVREVDRVWVQEFGTAGDIVAALKIQFAYQHREGLLLAERLRQAGRESAWMAEVSGETLRIALEKPAAWEYLLFSSALHDAIATHAKLRRRHQLAVPSGLGEDVRDAMSWIRARFSDARRFPGAIEAIVNGPVPEAFGAPGHPGNREHILFVAETLGDVYRDMLLWAQRVRTANIDDCFASAANAIAKMLDSCITELEDFDRRLAGSLRDTLPKILRGENATLEMKITMRIPESFTREFESALAEAARCVQRRG